jgi:hypothetical protein
MTARKKTPPRPANHENPIRRVRSRPPLNPIVTVTLKIKNRWLRPLHLRTMHVRY